MQQTLYDVQIYIMGYITFSQGKSTGKPLLVKSANSMFRKYTVGKPNI